MPKTMTIRLSDEQAEDLEMLARVEGVPVAEAVREAIVDRVAARRKDTDFQKRLRAHMKRNAEALQRLAS